ncbi:MAG TPA: M43 family zinc metalloprotease [Bacteroidia bacterium]|jgi:PKD repeat protein|nr:M43 family zinc metalloprotease [Bacteroidia bacterium]
MNKFLQISAVVILFTTSAFAQAPDGCITHKAMNDYFNQNPEARKAYEAREAIYEKQDAEAAKNGYKNTATTEKSGLNSTQGTVYYVPVVFHILHQNGPENITDAQAIACVSEMTTRYRKLNSDTVNTIPQFKSIAGDVQIEFRLATIDPNGNCTNGIVRHVDPHTVWMQNNFSWYTYTWNPTKYLNIYVVKSINGTAAAYTYLPGTFSSGASSDVIVARYDYVGSTGASTPSHGFCISHEAGHWFNLQHTWGNTNNPGVACGNDGVADTPITMGSNLVCNTSMAVCTPGVVENVQNYMDYSYCSTMFTAGQVARMRTSATSGTSGRSNVISASNGIATGITNPQICIPIANFHATVRTVCPNAIITFSDSSANAHPTSWNWSFTGGTLQGGTTVTDSMPKVSYAAPGTYAVSYTATTSAGSGTINKTGYITVLTNIASYNTQFTEGFETTTLPGADWSIGNLAATDWAITSSAAATGVKSAELDNMVNTAGNISILESTSFDISSFITPKLTFKYAYKQKATTDNDKMQIFSSIDCGSTWVSRWSRNGSTLANVTPASATAFTPTSGQFTTYTVNINGVAGQNNVRFRFAFLSDFGGTGAVGNNIFLDDINLFDASVGITSVEEMVGLTIYPNPSSGTINLDMNLSAVHNISVVVTDVLGRTIETIPAKEYSAGATSLAIAQKKVYQPGVYFINMDVDGKQITKKIIIQ